jgi:hypothetical protein
MASCSLSHKISVRVLLLLNFLIVCFIAHSIVADIVPYPTHLDSTASSISFYDACHQDDLMISADRLPEWNPPAQPMDIEPIYSDKTVQAYFLHFEPPKI